MGQGTETNGQWHISKTSEIIVQAGGHCLSTGNPSPPKPPSTSNSEVWLKPLSDGKRLAVALLNLNGTAKANITVSAAQLGLNYSKMSVRDLWAEKELGMFVQNFTASSVDPHGVAMVSISQAAPPFHGR